MANWKKVIVSGSDAILNTVTASFSGDGSGLTGISGTVTNALEDGNGIADFTYDGSSAGVTVAVQADGSTLSVGAGGVKVADAGITATQIATSVAGDGLAGGAGTALSVNVDDTGIEINSDTLRLKDDGVTNAKLANITRGSIKVGGVSNAPTDLDAKTDGYILVGDGTDVNSVAVSGDITLANDGSVSVTGVAADSVALGTDTTGNYVQSLANATNGGTSITNDNTEGGDATIALDINDLAAATVDVGADDIAIHSSGNGTRKESIADLVAGIAGTGLGASSGQLSVDYGSSGGNAVEGNTTITFAGTTNEITIDGGSSITLGAGGTVTYGLADTITGNRTFSNDVTVSGNLTVSGDYITANVTNLAVDDQFILINSGSATGDCGIIFGGAETATANQGAALFFDDATDVFGLASDVAANATGATLVSKLGNIEAAASTPSSAPTFQGAGTIHIDTSLTGLCDNNIWIYS